MIWTCHSSPEVIRRECVEIWKVSREGLFQKFIFFIRNLQFWWGDSYINIFTQKINKYDTCVEMGGVL
jgi:hypothetical protein